MSLSRAMLKSTALLLLALAIFVFGILFYCNTFLSLYPISGSSMQPLINATYDSGDFAYGTRNTKDVTYGDIIIYKKNSNKLVIKRVIAMSNDNIMIKEDNGEYALYLQYNSTGEWQKLEEDYVKDKSSYEITYQELYWSVLPHGGGEGRLEYIPASKILTDENGNKYYHVNEGEIFYAGDNRRTSYDCFDYGAMKADRMVAKVVYLIHRNEPRIWQVVMQFLGIYKWR